MPTTPNHYPHIQKDFLLISLGILILFLVGLGSYPYLVPSEARYIEIPRQMLETGDWITPRLNGIKYFEKPPLFYWVQALQMTLFGLGEFSGRLWTALMMTGICLVTGIATYKKYGRLEGILAPVILASSILGFISARIVLLDVPLSLFLVTSLFTFMFAVEHPPGRRRDLLLACMYGAAALATLTKGLIGIVIPAMVIGMWILLSNRWSLLLRVRLIPGLLFFLAVAAPWHYLAGKITPEFYHFYFIHEHFERFLTKSHHRYEPPWFFFAVLIVGFLPWTMFLIQAVKMRLKAAWTQRKEDGSDLYLLLWAVLPFTFFSLSDSKLVSYILPIFPVLALLVARYLVQIWRTAETRGYRIGTYSMAVFFLVMAAAYPVMQQLGGKTAAIVAPIATNMAVLSILLVVQAIALLWMLRTRVAARTLITSTAIFAVLFVGWFGHLAPHAATRAPLNSSKEFAEALKPQLTPEDEVMVFAHYYQDFPVYLDRNVTVVVTFGEMEFGRSIEPRTHAWMIDVPTMQQRWKSKDHRVFVLLRKQNFVHDGALFPNAYVVMENDGPNLLISNRPEKH